MERQVMMSVLLAALFQIAAAELSNTVSISITSRRNQTGHQITQFEISRNSDCDVEKQLRPLQVDVTQGEKKSGGQKSIYLSGSLTVPTVSASDYEFYPLVGRYKLHNKPRTWTEAFNICAQEGAHLAIINSDTEARVLTEMYKRIPKVEGATYDGSAFIGINDIVTEGKFVTIFGEDISNAGYAKWSKSEPNNAGGSATHPGQDCGAIVTDLGLLDDATCTSLLPFFCEQEL